MNKELLLLLLDEILDICEKIQELEGGVNNHIELKKCLKENYQIKNQEIESIIEDLKGKVKTTNQKEIDKLKERLINCCKAVNISPAEKGKDDISYSKIRARVSNRKHAIKTKRVDS